MARLLICLFGTFEVALDEKQITAFEYDKVRALLTYLAVESDRPHRRDMLTGLLWPEQPERKARQSLSQALSRLRRAIGDHEATSPFLIITPQTLQFNPSGSYELDVNTFTTLLTTSQTHDHGRLETCEACLDRFQRAAALYRGNFLAGFSLADSPTFEEWMMFSRERFHRFAADALGHLVECYQRQDKYERALHYAWQRVELDPWLEEAQRQLMQLLALNGQRGAALAQYETCCRLLAEELDVDPSEETRRLYEQIRAREFRGLPTDPDKEEKESLSSDIPPNSSVLPPSFIPPFRQPPITPTPFVAREDELTQLDEFLNAALNHRGRVVFITGGAGRGKTALIQEFTRHAQATHHDLIVVSGNGNAHTGIGDPYLPFRETLGLLTGDVEASLAAGAMLQDHASRLWKLLPLAVQALLDTGPDLIDTFLPGQALFERTKVFAPHGAAWLDRLQELLERRSSFLANPNPQQSALFEQYTRVLGVLADQKPLLLVLDDLQWADSGSISLLFHLGRRLEGRRILVVGAYRPTEVALGRSVTSLEERKRHPLDPLVHEFRRYFGEIEIDLSQTEDRQFVNAFLNIEPNRLSDAFRWTLYQQTKGHPLFTVELLQGMQERGDLIQDQQGRWIEGPALGWETLPVRVEAVIAERIDRLPEPLRDALAVASVEGETFTAEIVARVRAASEQTMVRWLSDMSGRGHRLVRAQGIRRTKGQRLSRYRFRHSLFQKYVYNGLDPAERAYLHEAAGNALESLYGEDTAEIAVQLARHFQEAGIIQKALEYLRRAGERSVRLSANEEAIVHFTHALRLLETLPESRDRDQQELMIQIDLVTPLQAIKGYGDPELGRICTRTRELCQQLEDTPQLFSVLVFLAVFYTGRSEHQTAYDIVKQLPGLAGRVGDPVFVTLAHLMLGWNLFFRGEFASARFHAEQMMMFYDPQQHHISLMFFGQDPGVVCLAFASWALWLLGYPDQALQRSREAVALAQELSHPMSLALAQGYAALLHVFRRDVQSAQTLAEACIDLSSDQGFSYWLASGIFCRGWALVEQGQAETGLIQMHQGITDYQATGTRVGHPRRLARLAETYAKIGQPQKGIPLLAEALTTAHRTEERYYEAEIHRLKGDILWQVDGETLKNEDDLKLLSDTSPEAYFLKAIEVARRQSAKSLELRAVMSLCRLRQKQGQIAEARQMLAEVFNWFAEGFDTADLQEAKALLEELTPKPDRTNEVVL